MGVAVVEKAQSVVHTLPQVLGGGGRASRWRQAAHRRVHARGVAGQVLVEAGSRIAEVAQQTSEEWRLRTVVDSEIRKKLDEVTVPVALTVPTTATKFRVRRGGVDIPCRSRTPARVDVIVDRSSNPAAVR